MDLPERIVDDLRVLSTPLLIWEFVRVRDWLSEMFRLPEFETELLVDLLLTDFRLFVLFEFELSDRIPVLLRAVFL